MKPSRKRQRTYALLFLFVSAVVMVYFGLDGWAVNGIPTQYLGGLFAVVGVLGTCGVNVWKGGPLDARLDDAPPAAIFSNRSERASSATPGRPVAHDAWWASSTAIRIGFLLAVVAYIWLGTLFKSTSHTITEGGHAFAHNQTSVLFGVAFNLIPLAAAWCFWRLRRDLLGVGVFLLMIPLVCWLVLPQLFMERVEITATHLVHRREPPHDRYNADVPFSEITAAAELQYENGNVGYLLTLRDDTMVELPSNTVITAARATLLGEFRSRKIPLTSKKILSEAR